MGSGNLGNDQTHAMMDCRINSLLNFNTPSTRLTTSSFFNGSTPSPQTLDWVVQKTSAAGLRGMLLFDYYLKQGPMGTYSQWYAIGAAYAARFRPNSPWMTANTAHPALGITLYQAFNEPDNTAFGPQIPIAQYHAGLKGLADGIHSVDPTLKVFPGGYARPNAQNDYTCGGYCTAVTDLLNDGTLAGIDLHTYFGFWTPVSHWSTSSQHNFDAVKSVCGITRDIDLCVTESSYGVTGAEGGSKPTPISEATSAAYNLTVLWDSMGVVGNAGQSVVQVSHTFALVLEDPTSAQVDLAFTTTQCPWVPNPRGRMIQMVAKLTQGMRFISLAPKSRGEYILTGSGGSRKKMWVWQDRTNWTNIGGTSYNVAGIPADATSLQVYNAAGLMRNITLTGQSSYNVTGLPVANTYMFVASGIPGTPATPVASPSRMNFEAPATVGRWTTLDQGLPPASLAIDSTQGERGAQSLKATGSVSTASGEWVFNVFSSPQDLSAQGQVFEAWVKLSPAFPGGSIGIISQDGTHTQAAGWVAMTGQTGWVHLVADYSGYTAAQWNKAHVTSVGIVLNTSAPWKGTVNVDEFDWHP